MPELRDMSHTEQRAQIKKDVEKFIAAGGVIQQIPYVEPSTPKKPAA